MHPLAQVNQNSDSRAAQYQFAHRRRAASSQQHIQADLAYHRYLTVQELEQRRDNSARPCAGYPVGMGVGVGCACAAGRWPLASCGLITGGLGPKELTRQTLM
jgi:hypothetical protein